MPESISLCNQVTRAANNAVCAQSRLEDRRNLIGEKSESVCQLKKWQGKPTTHDYSKCGQLLCTLSEVSQANMVCLPCIASFPLQIILIHGINKVFSLRITEGLSIQIGK